MREQDIIASKQNVKALVEGTIDWEEVKKMMRLQPKDDDRFLKYIEVLQERVSWKEKILCRISEHLYVVKKDNGDRVVKCDCGHEFGDYRINWKLQSRIRVRKTKEDLAQAYSLTEVMPNVELVQAREFYCPGCYARLAVEVVPVGYPLIFEILPDIDQVYREAGKPLDDESPDWFQDKTTELVQKWSKEG